MKTLILSNKEIKKLITVKESLPLVKNAFIKKINKKTQMPPKSYLVFDKYRGDIRTMPSYIEGEKIAVVKIVNSHDNNSKKNLPTVIGTIILIDVKTGFPLSIMDGNIITSLRTAAASAIATKYLAKKNAKTLGLIGAGIQANSHIEALTENMKIEKISVYDIDQNKARKLIKKIKEKSEIEIEFDSLEETVKNNDILVTTTPVRKPIVKDRWIEDGTHINAVGADGPGKQELESRTLKRSKIIIDDYEQAIHGGEINVPLKRNIIKISDIYGEIGEIITKKKLGRTNSNEITLFDSTGLAIQDAALAAEIYKKAEVQNVGKFIKLFSVETTY